MSKPDATTDLQRDLLRLRAAASRVADAFGTLCGGDKAQPALPEPEASPAMWRLSAVIAGAAVVLLAG